MNVIITFGAKYLFAAVLIGALVPLITQSRDKRITYLFIAIASGLIAFALTKFAGMLYFDPRPFTHGIRALISHEADNGFPSDHTVLSFVAATVCFQATKLVGSFLVFLATIVAICRVSSGVHWPIDAIAGALIGAGAVVLASCLVTQITARRNQHSPKAPS